MTNTALLCLSPRLKPLAPNASPVQWVLIFILLEHVILGLKIALMWSVNNQPEWVRNALDKVIYQSMTATLRVHSKLASYKILLQKKVTLS